MFWVKENPTEDLEHLPCVSKGSVAVLLKLGWRQRDLFEGYCKRDLEDRSEAFSQKAKGKNFKVQVKGLKESLRR